MNKDLQHHSKSAAHQTSCSSSHLQTQPGLGSKLCQIANPHYVETEAAAEEAAATGLLAVFQGYLISKLTS